MLWDFDGQIGRAINLQNQIGSEVICCEQNVSDVLRREKIRNDQKATLFFWGREEISVDFELRLRSTRDLSVSGSINASMVVKLQEHGIYCMRNNGFRVVFFVVARYKNISIYRVKNIIISK